MREASQKNPHSPDEIIERLHEGMTPDQWMEFYGILKSFSKKLADLNITNDEKGRAEAWKDLEKDLREFFGRKKIQIQKEPDYSVFGVVKKLFGNFLGKIGGNSSNEA